MVFIEKKLQKRSFGNINYNTDHNTDHDCTVYVNTDTDSDSLSLHTPDSRLSLLNACFSAEPIFINSIFKVKVFLLNFFPLYSQRFLLISLQEFFLMLQLE